MIFLAILLAQAHGSYLANCPSRSSLESAANAIGKIARQNDGELCAKADPDPSVDAQTKLLGLIRDAAVARLDRFKVSGMDVASMRERHARLRALQSLRHSTLVDSPTGLRLSPAVELKGPPGLPRPDPLQKEDVELAQRGYQSDIDLINKRLAGVTGAERRRLITELASPLQKRIRDAGQVGYAQIISIDPSQLFISSAHPTDGELNKGHARFIDDARDTATKLRKMDTTPGGDALGLIFFGPAVIETIKTRPEMCGAYQALLARARQSERFRSFANAGLGLAAGGVCLASGVLSAGTLTAACFALSLGEFGIASFSSAQSYRELEVLYGGLMQGASVADYEDKQRESQRYLMAAGLSGVGAAGALGGIRSGLIAAERESVIETAHLIGKGQVGRDGTPARVGNYTKDHIRQKIAELKRSRHIDREERKELIRSGRVGIRDADGLRSAEDKLAVLDSEDLRHLKPDTIKDLKARLQACVNKSLNCEDTFKAIAEAFDLETKPRLARIEELEQKITSRAEETKDEATFNTLIESLDKLAECKKNPLAPECVEVIADASNHVPELRVALQGPPPPPPPSSTNPLPAQSVTAPPAAPRKVLGLKAAPPKVVNNQALPSAPNPQRPWTSSAMPIEELPKLTFLTEENRFNLKRFLEAVSRDEQTIYRRRTAEKYGSSSERFKDPSYTPVDDLNKTLENLLGRHVQVVQDGTKISLVSRSRNLSVQLDPISRYFTVTGISPITNRQAKYIYFERTPEGTLTPHQNAWVPEQDFLKYSHFGY